MSSKSIDINIDEEEMKDAWEMIQEMQRNNIQWNEDLFDNINLNDIMIKPGKKKSKKQLEIIVGDLVNNDGRIGTVVDIDENLLCVRNVFGDIEVWDLKDVRKVNK